MNKICKKDSCTGCMACYNICPRNCIAMEYNQYEELVPIIDEKKCINCSLCRKVCPSNSNITTDKLEKKAYAVWSTNETDRQTSTSGGIASVFYNKAIEDSYIVFGTSFDESLHLKFSYTQNKQEILKYKGSKYCQSDIGYSYKKIKEFLNNDKKVLFIGTPCQVQGINKYLEVSNNKNKKNLITVDLVCHGVPSQKYLSEYIDWIEKNVNQTANKITFRESENYVLKLYKDEKVLYQKERLEDLFLTAFQLSLLQRESCMNCKYANSERVSDITIGDFWGIGENETITKTEKKKGISLVLINTQKGNDFFEKCREKVYYEERDVQEAINGNAHLRRPSFSSQKRGQFKKNYRRGMLVETLKEVLKEEMKQQKLQQKKNKIKLIIKRILRKYRDGEK